MFNYECTQMGGSVVGSCVDVFLFGACCRLPPGVKLPHAVSDQPTTAAAITTAGRRPPYDGRPQPPPSFQLPVADTILLHRNGTVVQNAYGPDDMSADLMSNFTAAASAMYAADRRPALAEVIHLAHQQYAGASSDWNHQQQHRIKPTPPPFASKITSKVDYGGETDSSSRLPPSWSSSSWSSSSSSPVSKSTDSVPNIRKTTPSAIAHSPATTTSKHGYGADDYYDGMVLVPTLTVHDPNAKTPVENNSIHHILSILNQTPPAPSSNAEDDDPMDTSPSYQHVHHTTSSQSPASAALYTWGSFDGDTKTPGYGPSSSPFPATRPSGPSHHHSSPSYYPQTQHYDRPSSPGYFGGPTPAGATTTTTATSTHHLPGPHFHVLSTTVKPDPVVPTVIVLSSADKNKYTTSTGTTATTTTTAAVYTSSSPSPSSYHRPPPSHVKPSQGIIVTGKPSVSAAYTTTATYHNHQPSQQHDQQQQNLPFVPVSSTTLADHYYNTNNYNVHHTSSKPLSQSAKPSVVTNYGHRPATTTTTSLPPTLSSTIYHDGTVGGGGGGGNNVFTTVITSVNHQYHNKYQSPTTVTSTVARPVLNSDAMAVVSSSSTGGYRPQHQQQTSVADDDYPSPVVTQSPQVFITASDVHHHHQHHTSSYPGAAVSHQDDDQDDGTGVVVTAFNSTDTFAFPPVRDPNVNLTASTQQEKPVVAGSGPNGAGDYDADADPNPQLTADDHLDDKVHLFVEKVVQSLQGNFEDLERVLLSGDTSSNVTVGLSDDPQSPSATPSPPNKKPTTTTKKPPRPGTKPPVTAKPTKPPKTTTTSTYRPTPITLALDAAPYLELTTVSPRPTKVPALLTPVQLFQPTTYTARPPIKQPNRVTPSTTVVLDTFNVEHDHTTAEPDYRKGTHKLY